MHLNGPGAAGESLKGKHGHKKQAKNAGTTRRTVSHRAVCRICPISPGQYTSQQAIHACPRLDEALEEGGVPRLRHLLRAVAEQHLLPARKSEEESTQVA